MKPTDKPIVNPVAVIREEFDDWAVLFNPDTAEAVGINPVGVVVWKQMDGRNNLDQIMGAVREHFDGVPEAAVEEVSTFIDDLAQHGFVGYEIENAVI